jgi:hypothetical protein
VRLRHTPRAVPRRTIDQQTPIVVGMFAPGWRILGHYVVALVVWHPGSAVSGSRLLASGKAT